MLRTYVERNTGVNLGKKGSKRGYTNFIVSLCDKCDSNSLKNIWEPYNVLNKP